jgi:hypothetical protein
LAWRKARAAKDFLICPVHKVCYKSSDMKDALLQFQALKTRLSAERESIQNRLAAINAVLESGEAAISPVVPASTTHSPSDYTPRAGSLPARILRALEKNGPAMQVKDIAGAVKGDRLLVTQACLMLVSKGKLAREGRGQYSLA